MVSILLVQHDVYGRETEYSKNSREDCSKIKYTERDCFLSPCLRGQGTEGGSKVTNETN